MVSHLSETLSHVFGAYSNSRAEISGELFVLFRTTSIAAVDEI